MRFCQHLAKQNGERWALAKIAIELAHDVGLAQARNVERMANSSLMLNPAYLEGIERHIKGIGGKRENRMSSVARTAHQSPARIAPR